MLRRIFTATSTAPGPVQKRHETGHPPPARSHLKHTENHPKHAEKQHKHAGKQSHHHSKHSKASARSSSTDVSEGLVTATANTSATSLNKTDDPYIKEKATLVKLQWYHGLMPRDEIEHMLREEGDFLVRRTEVGNISRFALSVLFKGRIRHLLLSFQDGMWAVRDVRKPSLAELIDHYVTTQKPVQSGGTALLRGVKRPPYYILHEHIVIGKRLGGGAFGDVHAGIWKREEGDFKVAIKKFKGVMAKKERIEFVREASIMRRFHHRNIVGVLGVAAQEQPLLILMDLSPNGALNSYLKKHPETSIERLVGFITDAARGMCYLSLSKVIHRDVAARNCLLGFDKEVKISDFGLSVSNSEEIKVQRLKNVPVRWLSPETLRLGVFSSKSDVWSFGVLMWEAFSYCKTDPFPGLSNGQARTKIQSGRDPIDPPDVAPPIIRTAMHLCFTQNPETRVDFESLLRLFSPNEKPPMAVVYSPVKGARPPSNNHAKTPPRTEEGEDKARTPPKEKANVVSDEKARTPPKKKAEGLLHDKPNTPPKERSDNVSKEKAKTPPRKPVEVALKNKAMTQSKPRIGSASERKVSTPPRERTDATSKDKARTPPRKDALDKEKAKTPPRKKEGDPGTDKAKTPPKRQEDGRDEQKARTPQHRPEASPEKEKAKTPPKKDSTEKEKPKTPPRKPIESCEKEKPISPQQKQKDGSNEEKAKTPPRKEDDGNSKDKARTPPKEARDTASKDNESRTASQERSEGASKDRVDPLRWDEGGTKTPPRAVVDGEAMETATPRKWADAGEQETMSVFESTDDTPKCDSHLPTPTRTKSATTLIAVDNPNEDAHK